MGKELTDMGTINIIVLVSAALTRPALVESVMLATEAKAAALQALGIKSPISNDTATGTGTDAIAIASGQGPIEIPYCGKHVIFGEVLGRLVNEAVTASVSWERGNVYHAKPPQYDLPDLPQYHLPELRGRRGRQSPQRKATM
jgi:adenosylcobinamide amidohydrolase